MIKARCAVALGVLATAASAWGQTAGMLSFQGLIKDAGGDPVQGTVTLEFRIYDAQSGGGLVQGYTPQSETATDGIVSTKFGPVSEGVFNGSPRWLEVRVNGVALPRTEIATAPAVAERLNVPGTGTAAVSISASGPLVSIRSLTANTTHLLVDSFVGQGDTPSVWIKDTTSADDQIVLRVTGDSDGDGGGPFNFEVASSGLVRARVLQITGGADLAERFAITATKDNKDNTGPVKPGHVVAIDPVHPGQLKLAADPYDQKVAGIISGANGLSPAMIVKAEGQPYADGDYPVALTGRVWCWCDASCGAIQPGDRLTTSTTPGHAMRVSDNMRASGSVIGKAMTRLETGTGLVLVLVQPQ